MIIVGDKNHIEVDDGSGRIAMFAGELGIRGFYADKDSIKWKAPHDKEPVSKEECDALIEKIEKEFKHKPHKIFFDAETMTREDFLKSVDRFN